MANVKISDLTAAASANTAMQIEVNDSGASKSVTVAQVNATQPTFAGDAGSGGTKGLVPAPATGDAVAPKLLRADGSWGLATFASLATAAVSTVSDLFASAASKLISVSTLWSAQVAVALTDAATIAVNMSTGLNFSVTLGGNRTLGSPTNAKAGQSGVIAVAQDGTGSRTLVYASVWDFGSAGTPTLSTTAGKVDLISYYVVSTSGPVVRAFFSKAS